jgi:hypothetical protein
VTYEPPFVTLHEARSSEPQDGFVITIGDTFDWSGCRYTVSRTALSPPLIPGGRFTVLGAGAMAGGMAVRGVARGDRIDIEVGSAKVKEALRVAGVPPRVRPHSLAVTVGAKIAALVGVRVASWAKPERGGAVVIIEREVGT